MLAGIFYGAMYGGSTTSILVRIPREAASLITCPDIFMFVPVFVDDYLLGYAVLVGHYNDVGGRVPGSSAADPTEIYQEGLRIPVLKLYERGRANETLLELIRINVRIPDVVLGDLQAQLAACRIGERGVSELARRYGIQGLERHFEELLAYSERAARQTIRSIPDGVYRYTDFLDDDGVHPDRPVPIRVAVEVRDDEVTFDFAGSSPQVAGAINCTLSFVKSAVYFALRSVMSSDAPNNAGFFRPITVKADLGSILNPRSPGACAARGVTGFRVIDAITGALAEAVPERIRAPGEGGTTSYSISGYDADGTFNMYREAVMGNWGGGAHRDGLDGVANPAANIGNAPCKVVERQAPLRIERYELVPDSGGAGQWRGGLAVMRQLRYLGERATLQLRSDRRHHRPFGVHGGLPGAASTNLLLDDGREEQWPTKFVRPLLRDQAMLRDQAIDDGREEQWPTKFVRPLLRDQAIRHVTAGAGGYGDPLQRDPARVLDDVRNGKVSVQAAERDYGVRVSGPPWCVEEPATRELRAARASSPDTAPGPRR